MLNQVELIGVPHHEMYLGIILQYLSDTYVDGIGSLLVELPRNWPDFVKRGLTDNFFHPLSHRLEQRGTRIFYGDRPRRVPKNRLEERIYKVVSLYDSIATNRRNLSIEAAVNEYEPEVVVVGRKHADYLREKIDRVHYTALERDWRNYPKFPFESLIHRIQGEPNNPDRLVLLQG